MEPRHHVHSDYLHSALNPTVLKDRIERAVEQLKDVEFDAFAVRGNSGVLFGGALAYRMNKGIILVRKETERSHSCWKVEGLTSGWKYIFLDDFVCSGATKHAVQEAMREDRRFKHYKWVGDYQYRDSFFWVAKESKQEEPEPKQVERPEPLKLMWELVDKELAGLELPAPNFYKTPMEFAQDPGREEDIKMSYIPGPSFCFDLNDLVGAKVALTGLVPIVPKDQKNFVDFSP